MLFFANDAGGTKALRYVSAAIIACWAVDQGTDSVERLRALGITWLTHFLYMFKEKPNDKKELHRCADDHATPTIDATSPHLQQGVGNRGSSFRDSLLLRDGFECRITGHQDVAHPSPRDETISLEAAHIIRRAIADFDKDSGSPSFKSAAATFGILVNFTHFPADKLDQLKELIDDPANGMLLQQGVHSGFESLKWCLEKIGENTYKPKQLVSGSGLLMRRNTDAPVIFMDRSSEFVKAQPNSRKRPLPISVPNENFISIHAAIAGIMFMSGAGKFFDELLDKYGDDDGSTPLVQWIDLERVIAAEEAGQKVADRLRDIQVSG